MDMSGSLHIFSILLFSTLSCCLILSCCECIFSDRKFRKHSHSQLPFANHDQTADIPDYIYTIEMPYTQSTAAEPTLFQIQSRLDTTEISLSV